MDIERVQRRGEAKTDDRHGEFAMAERASKVADELAITLERLGNSDPLVRLTETSCTEQDDLRHGFNRASRRLHDAIAAIALHSRGIQTSARASTDDHVIYQLTQVSGHRSARRPSPRSTQFARWRKRSISPA